MKRDTLQSLVRWLVKGLTHTEYIGIENIPTQGGVIFATNHLSQLDIPLLFVNPVRRDITALVTTKYQKHWLINWFCQTGEGIWIDRDIADFGAMRAASRTLQAGKALGIAPEGTRSRIGQLLPGKPGAVLLALKTNAPIIPVGITGTENAFRLLARLRKPHIRVRFGAQFSLAPLTRDNREQATQRYLDEIMCRIAALLPEEYRGAYRKHPQLKNFL
jgi:1-acyl-sn-glycerol-3-phosphate acyltransferase